MKKDFTKRKAPWKDFAGNTIYEGDYIMYPSEELGLVFYYPKGETVNDKWRVLYFDEGRTGYSVSRLCLQIGDKGMAIVIDKEFL